ncbi:SAM domain and HD domain, 1 [Strigomonas culicis]|uniref:SAM domain and HD domain, 1 n=1 Tax=Strigomonas culicis TaxID=28005 RepID=S9VNK8_9TRYP|nr:SAM domain and HD domain, 1 [Strigomonas culicis]|eukprot:EPY24870.1 SAM domain and HD domain, 1 [Strigomonas culicis]
MSYVTDLPSSWRAEDCSNLELLPFSQVRAQRQDGAHSLTPSNSQRLLSTRDSDGGGDTRRGGPMRGKRKIIFDRVHGQLVFPPVLCLFIDSPIVQRLRELKQLGTTSYVYPSATITRFEHSLGVSHLAMKFLKQILENHKADGGVPCALSSYEEEEITKDVWCVGIAGLCHDLGHGPLSHMFEEYVNTIRRREGKSEWCHEEASIRMLKRLWESKRDQLEDAGLQEADLQFVLLCMRGLAPNEPWPEQVVGRAPWKRFMVEIVANKRNDLDVDKLDYLQRDSLCCLGMPAVPTLDRIFLGACAAHVRHSESSSENQGDQEYVPLTAGREDEWQICYERKLYVTIEEVFLARARLHHIVYQHRVTRVVDQMLIDAFLLADPYFRVTHKERSLRLSETVDDVDFYTETGDWVVNAIANSTMPELLPAQTILANIKSRNLYSTIGFYSTSADKPSITAEKLLTYIKDQSFKKKLESWASENHGLASLVVLHVKITKAPVVRKDDDTNSTNPLSSIVFFNPTELGSVCEVRPVKGRVTFSCGVRNQNMFIFVSRMKCNEREREQLCNAWRSLSDDQKLDNAVPRSSLKRTGSTAREDSITRPLYSAEQRPRRQGDEGEALTFSQEESMGESLIPPPPPILQLGVYDNGRKRNRHV